MDAGNYRLLTCHGSQLILPKQLLDEVRLLAEDEVPSADDIDGQ